MLHLFNRSNLNSIRTVYLSVFLKRTKVAENSWRTCSIVNSEIVGQYKTWKRVSKNDPSLSAIIQCPEVKALISQLAKTLDCNEALITELIRRNSCLIASKMLTEKIKLLQGYGISLEEIVAQPSVLHRSPPLLKYRLDIMKAVQLPGKLSLHGIRLSDESFQLYIQKHREITEVLQGFPSHIKFLADLLDCEENEVATLAEKWEFLSSYSPVLLKGKVNILLKYKLSHQFIRENVKVLVYISSAELDRRLTLLQERLLDNMLDNIDSKLGYLLSCSQQEFTNSFNYMCKIKEALEGCRNKLEYLSFRLNCDEATAKQLICSRPINSLSEIKLKQSLDFFLCEMKVNPEFFLNKKELLSFSVKTLKNRWAILCDLGYSDVSSLTKFLSLSNKQFKNKFCTPVFI